MIVDIIVCLACFSDVKVADMVTQLFSEELIPVSTKAQKKVPVPEG